MAQRDNGVRKVMEVNRRGRGCIFDIFLVILLRDQVRKYLVAAASYHRTSCLRAAYKVCNMKE